MQSLTIIKISSRRLKIKSVSIINGYETIYYNATYEIHEQKHERMSSIFTAADI